jgi:hypothetical protein
VPFDITMCPGGDCPLRQRCYRYRGIPEGRQDYFGSPPFERDTCDSFWDIAKLEPTEDEIRTRAYHLWLAGGRVEGADETHWQIASAELRERARNLLR